MVRDVIISNYKHGADDNARRRDDFRAPSGIEEKGDECAATKKELLQLRLQCRSRARPLARPRPRPSCVAGLYLTILPGYNFRPK